MPIIELEDLLAPDVPDSAIKQTLHLPAPWDEQLEEHETPAFRAAQHKEDIERKLLRTSTSSADLASVPVATATAPGFIFAGGVHLPDNLDIASAYIENQGTVPVSYGVGGGSLTPFGTPCKNGGYKRISLPDGIRSLSLWITATGTGLVVVTLTTQKWSPTTGTL